MEVYILKRYDPDSEQDVIVDVFDKAQKATENVKQTKKNMTIK